MRKVKIFFVISAVIIAIGLIGYWKYQSNLYSKGVLKLEILGPAETKLLEEVEYAVKYKNNGNFNLEKPKLVFECPENSFECERVGAEAEEANEEKKLLRKELSLPTIYPGEERVVKFKARLMGKENETQEAKAELSYQPKNIRAVYTSRTTFSTQIKSALLNFEFDIPSRIESDRGIKFSLNYFSNLDYPLSDIGIKLEYPPVFQFKKSNPKALEQTDFGVKSLNKTEGGRIEIKGVLSGKPGEQKIFRAILGIWKDGKFIVLKEVIRGVEISESSLYISQIINGKPDYSANIGDILHYEIYFRNVGEKPFEKLSLINKLEGDMFDLSTIKSELGENSPGDNTIVWDWKKVPELKLLAPGQEGKVEFWVNLKKDIQALQGENVSVKNKIIFLPSQTEKEFLTKIVSKLALNQKGYINDEIFNSNGPLLPQVGRKSYFTIIWQVQNFYSSIGNVKVKAVLSPLAELTGKISPENAAFTFDSKSRELIWRIGDLAPQSINQLAFQIALTLKEEEKEKEPTLLLSEAEISGDDKWAGQTVSATSSAIYTNPSETLIGEIIEPYSTSRSSGTSTNEASSTNETDE